MKKCIVDTAVIRRNAEILKSLAGGSEIWAVVKGDGYGLGLDDMAGLLYDCGIRRFAVSDPHTDLVDIDTRYSSLSPLWMLSARQSGPKP